MSVAEILDLYVKRYNNTTEDYIHLAPASWFMPTFDAMNINVFHKECSNISMQQTKRVVAFCSLLQHTN